MSTEKLANTPRVLAIVVTFNAMPWLNRSFASLLDSSIKPDVVAIDNGSVDGTCEALAELFPEVRIVQNGSNLGFGAANNVGFRIAIEENYDFVYLMNQDAWVEKDTLQTLISSWSERFGVLSPIQKDAKENLDANFRKKCGKALMLGASAANFERKCDEVVTRRVSDANFERNSGRALSCRASDEIVEVPFVMAAHWLVSVKTLKLVGGFSPAFKHYGEDDNFVDRLHWHGLACAVVKSAQAVHDRATRSLSKRDRMKLKCVSARVKLSDPSKCFFLQLILQPLHLLAMSLKNFSLYPLKTLPSFIKNCPELYRLRRESFSEGAFL